jgi:membrane protein YdbS with pleckstrin-like domain
VNPNLLYQSGFDAGFVRIQQTRVTSKSCILTNPAMRWDFNRRTIGKLNAFPLETLGMPASTDPTDPAEPDLYWAGHSGWAMIPGVLVGLVLSAIVMFGLTSAGDLLGLASQTTALVRFWVVLLGWLGAGLVWAYRGASFVYRLTPTHLYVDLGMFTHPVPAIPLAAVTEVKCQAWALRRLFGVGAVVVHVAGRPTLRLRGIFRPQQFAAAIRRAIKNEAKAE